MRWDFKRKKFKIKDTREPVYRNPMFPKRTWQLFVIERFNFFILLVIFIFLAIIYGLFYSPLFQIKQVKVTTDGTINVEQVKEKVVYWQMQQRRFIIFKQNNIFLFSKNWLQENLGKRYSTEEISVNKNLPKTLNIALKEKLPMLVWMSGERYYYLDERGKLVREEQKDKLIARLPLVKSEEAIDIIIGKEIISQEMSMFIPKLQEMLASETDIKVVDFIIPKISGTQVNVETEEEFKIYFDVRENLEGQVATLKRALESSLKDKRKTLQYIDVRIADRVYYK